MEINSNFKIKDCGDRLYIFDSNYIGDVLYEFDNVGYDIVAFVVKNNGCEIAEIVDYLKTKYSNIQSEDLFADTLEFINELKAENIIKEDKNGNSSN